MATKKAAPKDEPKPEPKAAKTDAQGHPLDGPDYIPSEKDYDPAKHANHSHFNP